MYHAHVLPDLTVPQHAESEGAGAIGQARKSGAGKREGGRGEGDSHVAGKLSTPGDCHMWKCGCVARSEGMGVKALKEHTPAHRHDRPLWLKDGSLEAEGW